MDSIMIFISYIYTTPQMIYDISPYLVLTRSLQLTKDDECIQFTSDSKISIQYYLDNLYIIPDNTCLQTILGMVCYRYGYNFHHYMCMVFGETGIGAQFSVAMQISIDTGSEYVPISLTSLYRVCFPQEQSHVIFKFIFTELQIADILTKALSVPTFWYLGYMLMGHALLATFNIPGVQLYK